MIEKVLFKQYSRNLGLACVMASLTGIFVEQNQNITSLLLLLFCGLTASFVGLLSKEI